MKKVLLITNYFYPEYASLGQLMTDLSQGLKESFKVTVIAMVPGYTADVQEKYRGQYPNRINVEAFENMEIFRVYATPQDKSKKMSRIFHIISYFFYSIGAILKASKQDVVFCVSQPPVLGGLLGLFGKLVKGAKLIYNIQDFNPEQIEAVGYAKKGRGLSILRRLDNLSLKAADAIILVGRDQKETLLKRGLAACAKKVHVINNWIDQKENHPLPADHPEVLAFRAQYGLTGKRVCMYSGNLGLFYDLENLIKIMEAFDHRADTVFALVGDGAVKQALMAYCQERKVSNVVFIPYQEKARLVYSLNAADLHIVANLKGIKGVSVPSKLYGVMAVGKPILGILEAGSEAQQVILESGCGECVEPGDYTGIQAKLAEFLTKRDAALQAMGQQGRAYLEKALTMESSVEKYKKLIENLE